MIEVDPGVSAAGCGDLESRAAQSTPELCGQRTGVQLPAGSPTARHGDDGRADRDRSNQPGGYDRGANSSALEALRERGPNPSRHHDDRDLDVWEPGAVLGGLLVRHRLRVSADAEM